MARRGKEVRINIRVDGDMMGWIRRASDKQRVSMSAFIRAIMLEKFEQRHKV